MEVKMKCQEEEDLDGPYMGTAMDTNTGIGNPSGLVTIRKVEQQQNNTFTQDPQLVILKRKQDDGRCYSLTKAVNEKLQTFPDLLETTNPANNLKRRMKKCTTDESGDESPPCKCKIGGTTEETEIASRVMKTTQAFNNGLQTGTTDIILDHGKFSSKDMPDINLVAGSNSKPLMSTNGVAFKLPLGKGQIVVKQFQKRDAKDTCQVDCKEVLVPFGLKHKSIVAPLGVKCSPTQYSIVMEDGGESVPEAICNQPFQDYLRSNFKSFCAQLYDMVTYLEEKKVSHRDVKPGNLGIVWKNSRAQIKLFDFGSAQGCKDEGRWSAHTPEFLPPALVGLVIERKGGNLCEPGDRFFKERADLYAISMIVVWLRLGGRHPIDLVNKYSRDPAQFENQRMFVFEMIRDMKSDLFEPLLLGFDEPLRTVLRETLHLDPEQRWSSKVYEYLSAWRRQDFHKTPPPATEDPPPRPQPSQVATEAGPSDTPLMESDHQETLGMRVKLAGKGGGGGGGGGNCQARVFLNNANSFGGGQCSVTGIDSLVQKPWIETCHHKAIGMTPQKSVEQQVSPTIGIAPRKPVVQQEFQTIGIAPQKSGEQQVFGIAPRKSGEQQTFGIAPRKPVVQQAFQTFGITPRKSGEQQTFGIVVRKSGEQQTFGIAPQKFGEQQPFGIAVRKCGEQRPFGIAVQNSGEQRTFKPTGITDLGVMANGGIAPQQHGTLRSQREVEMEMTGGGGGGGGESEGNIPNLTELMEADGRGGRHRGAARGTARGRMSHTAIAATALPLPSPLPPPSPSYYSQSKEEAEPDFNFNDFNVATPPTQLPNLAAFDAAINSQAATGTSGRKTLKAARRN